MSPPWLSPGLTSFGGSKEKNQCSHGAARGHRPVMLGRSEPPTAAVQELEA